MNATYLMATLAVFGLVAGAAPALAVSRPDTTKAFFVVVADTPERFLANGSWSSVDRTEPPDKFDQPIPNYTIPNTVHWIFGIGKQVRDWRLFNSPPDDGADDVINTLEGIHVSGPHPIDFPTNPLPRIQSSLVEMKWNTKPAIITAKSVVAHPLTVPGKHWDHYGVRQEATAMQGPPHKVVGPTTVSAKHTGSSKDTELFGGTTGSSSGSGGKVSFNAATGDLTIHFGSLDVFNRAGSSLPGVDAQYTGDPILNGTFADLTLQFMGPTGDGGFRFGGAADSLSDPEGQIQLKGEFSEYLIYDTSRSGIIDSYAILEHLATADVGGDCASSFLAHFVEDNVTGGSLPEPLWLQIQGTCLTFTTAQNLVLLTAGFTVSVIDVPATVLISAGRIHP